MSRSPSMHSSFFSSLNRVEKRLKLEDPSSTDTDSLSSPIYLLNPEQGTKPVPSSALDSELPCEFLTVSHKFSATQDDSFPRPQSPQNASNTPDEPEDVDDIQLLMRLLHLPNPEEETSKNQEPKDAAGLNIGQNDEFYAKVVGTKGPLCGKEAERLEGWIRHFENGGGVNRLEPLRLAHLLLAKAASVSSDEDGMAELEFPSTIHDFLLNDPPHGFD